MPNNYDENLIVRKNIELYVLLWLTAFCTLTYAQTTLAQDLASYDWASLALAFAAGLVGGAGRTILTLASGYQLVGNIRLVLLKDMVVALIGGAFAFLCIQGYNSFVGGWTDWTMPQITRDFRVLIIVLAGASRGRWLGVLDRLAADAIANARHKLRGAAPQEELPTTVPAPLGDQS